MKREEFDLLLIDEKVNYINEQLQSGLTMKQIAQQLNYNDSTLRKKLNKAGYHMEDGLYTNVKTNVTTEVNENANVNTDVTQELDVYELAAMLKNNPTLFIQTIGQQMSFVLERLEEIEKRLKAKKTDVTTNAITVDITDGEMKLVSFRLNETVYEQWKQFTNEQKVYRSQDLLAMALSEYIGKYK